MNAKIYIDNTRPIVAVHSQKLSDVSIVWNLYIGKGEDAEEIACQSERQADAALRMIADALKIATGEMPLIL